MHVSIYPYTHSAGVRALLQYVLTAEHRLYTEHILDIQAVLTGQEPLDASCEEPLRTARLHAGMMGEEAVTTVTDSSGNHSQKTKKSSM